MCRKNGVLGEVYLLMAFFSVAEYGVLRFWFFGLASVLVILGVSVFRCFFLFLFCLRHSVR